MRRSNAGWAAACDDAEAVHEQLVEAIRDAVGHERGEGLLIGPRNTAALEQWIRETAAHIVGDTLH